TAVASITRSRFQPVAAMGVILVRRGKAGAFQAIRHVKRREVAADEAAADARGIRGPQTLIRFITNLYHPGAPPSSCNFQLNRPRAWLPCAGAQNGRNPKAALDEDFTD